MRASGAVRTQLVREMTSVQPIRPALRKMCSCEVMPDQNRACELCKKLPRRSTESLLCQDCADVISRIMSCDVYEANQYRDRQAQLAQARLLVEWMTTLSSVFQNDESTRLRGNQKNLESQNVMLLF
jgi:hypothetical protein